MDLNIKHKFLNYWSKYFGSSELPIVFYYSSDPSDAELLPPPSTPHRCFIGDLAKVRKGVSLAFNVDSIGCQGGKKYLGFTPDVTMPDFEYFLSCGIPGELEGERYKKTPEMVKKLMSQLPRFEAPEKYIVFKRWDVLKSSDDPEVVIFFAKPDVLSGLFTLANFDEAGQNVSSPFSSGCGSIVMWPMFEREKEHPGSILGMFDVSARPFVQPDLLSFAVPFDKFTRMADNVDESFLITYSWEKVMRRLD